MTTLFQIPRVLRQYCDDQDQLRLPGATVGELLGELKLSHPQLYQCVCNETGAVRQHIHLFVNHDLLRDCGGLAARLGPGDIVSVFQAVSGG